MPQPIASAVVDDFEHCITLTVEEVAALLGLGSSSMRPPQIKVSRFHLEGAL